MNTSKLTFALKARGIVTADVARILDNAGIPCTGFRAYRILNGCDPATRRETAVLAAAAGLNVSDLTDKPKQRRSNARQS